MIDQLTFDALKKGNDSKVAVAENTAVETVRGYLDSFDCDKIFSATGAERSAKIIQILCDLSLYSLVSAMPQKMGYEVRKERYDLAISWLSSVRDGKITVALPVKDVDDSNASVMMSSDKPKGWMW